MRIYIDSNRHPFWITYKTNPPINYIKTKSFARLQHCFNHIPNNTLKPYIVDCEHILHLSGESRNYKKMITSVDYISKELNSPNCKAIIFPTNGAIKDSLKYIKNKSQLNKKFKKILPSISVMPKKNFLKINNGPFTILNIGNKFWGKGTPIALEVYNQLRLKYGCKIHMILVCGDIPNNFPIPEGVEVIESPKLTLQIKTQLYNKAHIFLFPCLHDSFGVYLESLSFGVPMLSTNIYDKNEIVIDGKTGYLFNTPLSMYDGEFGIKWKSWEEFQLEVEYYFKNGLFNPLINDMTNKIEELITNRTLLEELSLNSQRFCSEKLGIDRKNKEIFNLYKSCY